MYIGWFDPSLTFKFILSGKLGSPTVLPRANKTNGNEMAATKLIKQPPPIKYFLAGLIFMPLGFGYSFSTRLEHLKKNTKSLIGIKTNYQSVLPSIEKCVRKYLPF